MRIGHVALWTTRLEELKEFYMVYFGGKAGEKYVNPAKGFESYFISFGGEASLELMSRRDVCERAGTEQLGFCHLSFSLPDRATVDRMTERLRGAGVRVVGEPRLTGDGMYESVVLDPDGNRIELCSD